VLADRRVRTAAGLDPEHALLRQDAAPDQELGVFLGIDVVGDHGHVEAVAEPEAQSLDQRRLARPYRAADSDPQGARNPRLCAHERTGLISSVACRMPAISIPGAKLQRSPTPRPAASRATRSMTG